MDEQEFTEKWEKEKPIFQAWGESIRKGVLAFLRELPEIEDVAYFIKIPPEPRLKQNKSLLDKAFHRGKPYKNPYSDIEDKVGLRFVVLLISDIRLVERAIVENEDWGKKKDKDFEDAREAFPAKFDYESLHYVVWPKLDLHVDNVVIPAGTTCEVQIRTLLQHAFSEIAHDSLYKPAEQKAPPIVERLITRSMAMIEATDESFEKAMEKLNEQSRPMKDALHSLSVAYVELVGVEPEREKVNTTILRTFPEYIDGTLPIRLRQLIDTKPFVGQKILEHSTYLHLFRQASILLAYLVVIDDPYGAKAKWPFVPSQLDPIYADLGLSPDL